VSLNILDYPNIVKNPMDFSTIRMKVKEHEYERIQEFMSNMELNFHNERQQ